MVAQYEQVGVEQDFQHGFKKGFQLGFQQGFLDRQRKMLIYFLQTQFGALPESLVSRVNGMTDPQALTAALGRAATAQTLEDTGI